MLNGAADADGHVELRAHLTAGLPNLIAVRPPAVVGDGASRAHGRVAECIRQLFHDSKILRRLEPASAGDNDWGVAEIGASPRPLFHFGHGHDSSRRRGECDRLRPRRPRGFHCRDGAWPHTDDGKRSHNGERKQHLVCVSGMRHDKQVPGRRDVEHVGRDRCIEARGDSRAEVAPLGGKAEQDRAILSGLCAIRNRGRQRFACEDRQLRRLDDEDHVGAALGEISRLAGNAGRTREHRMHFTAAGCICETTCRRHHFQRDLPQLRAARLGPYENVGHQSTFASVWSSRTSSGTAATPSPMIRPAGRSGGSCAFCTVTRVAPSCAGFVSSGFFFAAMMPLSDG